MVWLECQCRHRLDYISENNQYGLYDHTVCPKCLSEISIYQAANRYLKKTPLNKSEKIISLLPLDKQNGLSETQLRISYVPMFKEVYTPMYPTILARNHKISSNGYMIKQEIDSNNKLIFWKEKAIVPEKSIKSVSQKILKLIPFGKSNACSTSYLKELLYKNYKISKSRRQIRECIRRLATAKRPQISTINEPTKHSELKIWRNREEVDNSKDVLPPVIEPEVTNFALGLISDLLPNTEFTSLSAEQLSDLLNMPSLTVSLGLTSLKEQRSDVKCIREGKTFKYWKDKEIEIEKIKDNKPSMVTSASFYKTAEEYSDLAKKFLIAWRFYVDNIGSVLFGFDEHLACHMSNSIICDSFATLHKELINLAKSDWPDTNWDSQFSIERLMNVNITRKDIIHHTIEDDTNFKWKPKFEKLVTSLKEIETTHSEYNKQISEKIDSLKNENITLKQEVEALTEHNNDLEQKNTKLKSLVDVDKIANEAEGLIATIQRQDRINIEQTFK